MTTGRIFKDPVSGETFQFSQTGAEMLEIQTVYRPNSPKPPPHFHPRQREHFEIVEGGMTVEMDGQQRVYQAGETFDVPAGTPHAMWNAGDITARIVWQIRPALDSQAFFETLWGLREDGKVNANATPALLQAAVLMQAYADEFRLVKPPRPVQVILFGILGFIGRLMGYQARYDAYSK